MLSFKPTCDPQVGSNKIFHFFLRWTVDDAFFFFFHPLGQDLKRGCLSCFLPCSILLLSGNLTLFTFMSSPLPVNDQNLYQGRSWQVNSTQVSACVL